MNNNSRNRLLQCFFNTPILVGHDNSNHSIFNYPRYHYYYHITTEIVYISNPTTSIHSTSFSSMNHPYAANVPDSNFIPETNMNLRREMKEDMKRKKTIQSKNGYRNRNRNKRYPLNTADCDVQEHRYQENHQSGSTLRSFQEPSTMKGGSNNKNTHTNQSNTADKTSDSNRVDYNTDDGIRVYESNSSNQDNSKTLVEDGLLDEEEDSLFYDEQKELFDLLKDEEDLTPEESYILGYIYESGDIIDPDYKQAIKHYTYASINGDRNAKCNLGYLYERGYNNEGVKSKENYADAIRLYEEAAEQGSAQAQYNLATFCERGIGVKKDIQKAINLYECAAKQSHHEAQANLGYLYFDGKEVKKDYSKAYRYYRDASEGGIPRAYFALGYLYQFGLGVGKSHIIAYGNYSEAFKKGYTQANINIEAMYKEDTNNALSSANNEGPILENDIYDEFFNVGDAYLGGINHEQNIDLAYQHYKFNINSSSNGSIERGMGMYYQYFEPDSEHIIRATNFYMLSIQYGCTASYYFLGMLFLQTEYFELARDNFKKLFDINPNNNASYLFVENEDEFKYGRRPVPVFTKISEKDLLNKAIERFVQADELLQNELKLYNQLSGIYY